MIHRLILLIRRYVHPKLFRQITWIQGNFEDTKQAVSNVSLVSEVHRVPIIVCLFFSFFFLFFALSILLLVLNLNSPISRWYILTWIPCILSVSIWSVTNEKNLDHSKNLELVWIMRYFKVQSLKTLNR